MTDLLPPNATALEKAVAEVFAARIGGIPTSFRDLWNANTCPEELLPFLAWSLSIDQWDPDWPIAVRRARVASAIAVQRRRGTIDAVRRSVSSLGGAVSITEWWQKVPRGRAHTFSVTLSLASADDGAPSALRVDQAISEITLNKPLRSHFEFVLAQNAVARIGLRAVGRPVVFARLNMAAPAYSGPLIPTNALTLRGDVITLRGDFLTIGS